MIYDFIVCVQELGRATWSENRFSEKAIELTGCVYSEPYVLYLSFWMTRKTEIEDGMRMAVDCNSIDH